MKTPLDFYQWVYYIRQAIEGKAKDNLVLVDIHRAHADLMTCPSWSDEEEVFIRAYEHIFNVPTQEGE